ncbi:MAG: right-handed parallel beta-helix repeat-containing protein [Acidimicrobiales bacterium]
MRNWASSLRRQASRRRIRSLVPLLAALVAMVSVSHLVINGGPRKPVGLAAEIPGCATPMAVTAPAADLASLVAAQAEGTCFLLADGEYRFHDVVPKNGMSFVGASTAGVVVNGAGHENAFHGTADRVTIAQMTFAGFDNAAGTSAQEQAPIRGTAALWASEPGRMATNWMITDIVSRNNVASGVFLGDNFTVRNSELHHNAVTGIGGDSIVGALIEDNVIHHNGSGGASGAAANGAGVKLTQSGTADKPVIVRNNELHSNHREALWFDLACHGIQVLDNYIHDHVSRGVMFELSSGLVVRGNTILRSNTWTDFTQDFNAGAVTVGESADALVEGNTIDTAEAAVIVRQTGRPYPGEDLSPYPGLTFTSANVTVRHNVVRNSKSVGISMGVSGPQAIDTSTIRFIDNSYDTPAAMSFRWNDGTQTFDQWQAAGRDTTTAGQQLTQPEAVTDRGPDADPIVTETTTSTTAPTTASTNATTSGATAPTAAPAASTPGAAASAAESAASSAAPAPSTAVPATAAARRTRPATAAKPATAARPVRTRPEATAVAAEAPASERPVVARRQLRWNRFLREEMRSTRRAAGAPFRPVRVNPER